MKIKYFKSKLFATLMILIWVAVMKLFELPCIILCLTGIRCPGCGMTRALTAALHFDFAKAFSYHMMFWSVPLLYLCFLKDGILFKNKTLNTIFYIFILIGFLINMVIVPMPT